MHRVTAAFLALSPFALWTSLALAEQPSDFLAEFQKAAAKESPAFAGFDAARGEQFFKFKHSDWSCASCHTDDPRQEGKHARTEKRIAPLAPVANDKRFTDPKKVEKWFKRNCNDVVKRACTAQEKGDMLTYLLSLKL
jgi:mono/diheme cytochrome c family protein